MFREMRRFKQQVSQDECKKILKDEKRAAFSVIGDEGYPYTIPINFYYEEADHTIYFHGAREGHKMDAIQKCNKVCLTTWNQGFKKEGNTFMIIQTGMRTDIPAFYSEWLCNRIKEGYVMVRNPYQPQQVTRYTFSPSVVDLIAFCSKNPAPMLSHMDLLKTYGMYWFVTITPYGKEIEPLVPDVEAVIDTFRQLAEITGPDSMGWRYDPIFLNETYTPEVHIQKFTQIAQALEGYTHTCVISFIDLYQKVRRNFPEAQAVPKEKRLSLGKTMIQIAAAHGMKVYPCGEGTELACYGADCNGCMTQETYEKALHTTLDIPKKQPLRKECACFMGNDIGAYNTCLHGCKYCYANYDTKTVRQNYALHDPKSPFLIGNLKADDKIHQADQKSWIDGQLVLKFD